MPMKKVGAPRQESKAGKRDALAAPCLAVLCGREVPASATVKPGYKHLAYKVGD